MQQIREMLTSDHFMPHGMCYLWKPELLWTHVVSDFLIGGAYFAISLMLVYLVYRSAVERVDEAGPFQRLPFWWMFLAFGLFIVACGATHFVGVWTVWNPDYWFSGGVKVVTAVASVATAVALPPLIPRALGLVRAARASEVRKGQLEVANHELAAAHARIKELDELKTQFFANVSHELRTPLALILGPTEKRLAEEESTPEERALLELVLRNARVLHKHVDDLLDVTRLEAGELAPDLRRVDLAALVRGVADLFQPAAAERQVDLAVEAPPTLETALDPDAIERVLLNLISNALKFTPDGGSIVVRLEEAHGTARLEVRDSGPGVPEHLRATIFERFRQLDGGATRAFGGTGLGLTIVKEFVEMHDGTVQVGDAPEGGAAFIVQLPLRALDDDVAQEVAGAGRPSAAAQATLATLPARGTEEPPPPAGPALDSAGVPAGDSPGDSPAPPASEGAVRPGPAPYAPAPTPPRDEAASTPLVLVVEDNEELGGFLLSTLPEGVRGVLARDGREGLERARELQPDVIVSDVMMPRMSGDQLLSALRASPELARIPFLALTAKADEDLKVRMLESGAQDYITKPFHPAEVSARVRNWVDVSRAAALMRRDLSGAAGEDLESLAREVASSRARIQAALEAAETAREREAAASHAKSEFLSVMSHELRTPLNAIIGYAELMEQGLAGPLTDRQEAHLERIRSNTRHLLSMIEDILDFPHLATESLELRPESVDLEELMRDLEALVSGQALDKGLHLEIQHPAELSSFEADGRRLRQILVNLLENAVKYTEEGEVTLTVRSEDQRVRFHVADTGIGIDPDHREHIFDPFWQVDQSATRLAQGVGLGLSISRQLARRMGGDITVQSREGGGSIFTLDLPR